MSADVVIIVPVLNRPQSIAPLLQSIDDSTTVDHRVLFVCSTGDADEIAALDELGADYVILPAPWEPGDYARKINAAVRATTEPLVFTGADDLRFHSGWFEAATARFVGRCRVVGTNDLCNPRVMRGEHATHFLVQRSYVDDYGTVDEDDKLFHEGYPHEYVDDEFIGTARMRRRYQFAGDSHVEHLHPACGKGEMDALYAMEPERMVAGRKIYRHRRRLWMRGETE